ncbi:hypothetical protein SCP_1001360 [Sparassis crispa]|uniref:Uncharacterized protein n=1 Tax=Sparassis crispa TaxID=139825 RepID=A0A401GXI4_9APHY|nr:hypothetical protein SCP_1001360 [Sparassis crispa]GBE86892.1 hypothetical protein SCP_1001360 [Sparassis crispa]
MRTTIFAGPECVAVIAAEGGLDDPERMRRDKFRHYLGRYKVAFSKSSLAEVTDTYATLHKVREKWFLLQNYRNISGKYSYILRSSSANNYHVPYALAHSQISLSYRGLPDFILLTPIKVDKHRMPDLTYDDVLTLEVSVNEVRALQYLHSRLNVRARASGVSAKGSYCVEEPERQAASDKQAVRGRRDMRARQHSSGQRNAPQHDMSLELINGLQESLPST